MGQAIVKRVYQTFKTLLNKQKMENQETSPRNLTMLAMYIYNFLNCDDNLKSPNTGLLAHTLWSCTKTH